MSDLVPHIHPATTILCTVGTSLLRSQLPRLAARLSDTDNGDTVALHEAYIQNDWHCVVSLLSRRPVEDPVCGAELNSIGMLIRKKLVAPDCRIVLFFSDTPDGATMAEILGPILRDAGHDNVECLTVKGLTDEDPQQFRIVGLRNLARQMCRVIRDYGPSACAINATGGYKAQIAIAVVLGQAISIPVYYKHERFDDIIAFPPLPIGFDFPLWLKNAVTLRMMARNDEPMPFSTLVDEWAPELESLVERVPIDGEDYVVLSATGQIFDESFRQQFDQNRARLLPPAASRKLPCRIKLTESHLRKHEATVTRFMEQVRDENPAVVNCYTRWFSPDQPNRVLFRIRGNKICTYFSDGTMSVEIVVESTAESAGQQQALCVALNEWYESTY